jgi:hypothetical protein
MSEQPIYWLYTPRGGYGYTQRVPATIVERSKSGKRVLIRAQLARGGEKLVYVQPENTEPRQA